MWIEYKTDATVTIPNSEAFKAISKARCNLLAERQRLEDALIARVKPDFDRAHAEKDTFKAKVRRFITGQPKPANDELSYADSMLSQWDWFADNSPYNPEHRALRNFGEYDYILFSRMNKISLTEDSLPPGTKMTISANLWKKIVYWANKSGTENE